MYKKQLGRRNLSDEQRTMLMGNMLSVRKKRVGAPEGNKNRCENNLVKNTELKKDQKAIKEGTAGEIAKELGVSEKTVRNAEKFAEGIDALEKISYKKNTRHDRKRKVEITSQHLFKIKVERIATLI